MNTQFRKGVLEICVLALISKKDMYGYEIVQSISKVINEDIFYFTKIILSLIITLQGISISFLIPFINKTIFPLNAKEIIIVILERYAIILFLSSTIYYFYLNYIIWIESYET